MVLYAEAWSIALNTGVIAFLRKPTCGRLRTSLLKLELVIVEVEVWRSRISRRFYACCIEVRRWNKITCQALLEGAR